MAHAPHPAQSAGGYTIHLHPPRDSNADRNRVARWIHLILVMWFFFITSTFFLTVWLRIFHNANSFTVGAYLGFLALLVEMYIFSSKFFVYNPEWHAYVTNDILFGGNVPYGPGLHPTFFWEARNAAGNYSLQVKTLKLEIPAQSRDAVVIVTVTYQYAIDLRHITNYIGVDPDEVEEAITTFVRSFLTARIATMTSEEARKAIGELNKALDEEFGRQQDATDIETKYGIVVVTIIIDGMKAPPAVQKTRDAKDEAKNIREVMANLKGMSVEEFNQACRNGTINREEEEKLRGDAMAASENATLSINEVRGSGAAVAGAGIANLATNKNKP